MRVNRQQHIHCMTADNEPVATVRPGTVFTVETMDALDGRVTTLEGKTCEYPLAVKPPREEVNPATGPIYIEGADPGDAIAVNIRSIRPRGTGYLMIRQGALRGKISTGLAQLFPLESGKVRISESIVLDLDPMIGVIGVAPKQGGTWTHSPGDHGGNLDTATVRTGATVYLPVFHPGALLALGDVHALMGDGEIPGQGIECCADLELEVQVIKGWRPKRPLVENKEHVATVASHENLEQACLLACADMVDLLSQRLMCTDAEALLLVGLAGNLRVSQIVNPLRTARVEIPRTLLPTVC